MTIRRTNLKWSTIIFKCSFQWDIELGINVSTGNVDNDVNWDARLNCLDEETIETKRMGREEDRHQQKWSGSNRLVRMPIANVTYHSMYMFYESLFV